MIANMFTILLEQNNMIVEILAGNVIEHKRVEAVNKKIKEVEEQIGKWIFGHED